MLTSGKYTAAKELSIPRDLNAETEFVRLIIPLDPVISALFSSFCSMSMMYMASNLFSTAEIV
jgi:hypothetical protein